MDPSVVDRTAAIVVAGGSGSRFGGPKHSLTIDGTALWERCVETFRGLGIKQVIVVGDVPGGIPGGERRQDSVANGLARVAEADFVLAHDAARPLATEALLEAVLERLARGDVDGVVPGLRVTDTVKKVSGDLVDETLDRASLVTVQTPQGFVHGVLARVHAEMGDRDVTDDASMVEHAGGRVAVVEGDPSNLKVTYPEDLERARTLAKQRRGG